jgi:hypothetical protein
VLPDVMFSNQNADLGKILEGRAIKDVDKFYGHFVYFTAILCYIFGIFFSFWYVVPKKSGSPGTEQRGCQRLRGRRIEMN